MPSNCAQESSPLRMYWVFVPTDRAFSFTVEVREALHQPNFRNRNMNSKVTRKRGKPFPPTPLEPVVSHRASSLSFSRCQDFLGLCGVRALSKILFADINLQMRMMLKESSFSFSLLLVHDHSHLQYCQSEILIFIDNIRMWLVSLSNWTFYFNSLSYWLS